MSTFINKEKISTAIMAMIFIFLYGSGFVAAKLGFPYAKPLIYLVVRFAITTVVLTILAYFLKSRWPSSWREASHISVSGLFLVCIYSASAWISMDMGVPPAITALITALQPIVVSVLSYFLFRKNISSKQWIGLMLGLMGVGLVVGQHAHFSRQYNIGILMSLLSLLSLSVGNIYQKRFCHAMNIITGGVIQSITSGVVCFVAACFFEPFKISWSGEFVFALLWMAIVMSVGANSILYVLLRRGESHTVASLFYLIPAVTALTAYFALGSTLNAMQLFGMLVTLLGVGLVNVSFNRARGVKQVQRDVDVIQKKCS